MNGRDRNHHGGKGGVREGSSDEGAIRAQLEPVYELVTRSHKSTGEGI